MLRRASTSLVLPQVSAAAARSPNLSVMRQATRPISTVVTPTKFEASPGGVLVNQKRHITFTRGTEWLQNPRSEHLKGQIVKTEKEDKASKQETIVVAHGPLSSYSRGNRVVSVPRAGVARTREERDEAEADFAHELSHAYVHRQAEAGGNDLTQEDDERLAFRNQKKVQHELGLPDTVGDPAERARNHSQVQAQRKERDKLSEMPKTPKKEGSGWFSSVFGDW